MFWSNYLWRGASRWGIAGADRTAWQWQPTLTVHDPNPPITLEDGIATDDPETRFTVELAWEVGDDAFRDFLDQLILDAAAAPDDSETRFEIEPLPHEEGAWLEAWYDISEFVDDPGDEALFRDALTLEGYGTPEFDYAEAIGFAEEDFFNEDDLGIWWTAEFRHEEHAAHQPSEFEELDITLLDAGGPRADDLAYEYGHYDVAETPTTDNRKLPIELSRTHFGKSRSRRPWRPN